MVWPVHANYLYRCVIEHGTVLSMNRPNHGERIDRSKSRDTVLLLGTGLCVCVIGFAAFWVADSYNITMWLLGGLAALGLLIGLDRMGYRPMFRKPKFLAFIAGWLIVHVAIFLLVLVYLGFPYYVPILMLELWLGAMTAIALFGPSPKRLIH